MQRQELTAEGSLQRLANSQGRQTLNGRKGLLFPGNFLVTGGEKKSVIAQLSMFIGELQNQYLHLQVLNISFFNFFPTVLFAYEKLLVIVSMP